MRSWQTTANTHWLAITFEGSCECSGKLLLFSSHLRCNTLNVYLCATTEAIAPMLSKLWLFGLRSYFEEAEWFCAKKRCDSEHIIGCGVKSMYVCASQIHYIKNMFRCKFGLLPLPQRTISDAKPKIHLNCLINWNVIPVAPTSHFISSPNIFSVDYDRLYAVATHSSVF